MSPPKTILDCRGFEVRCSKGCWYGHIKIFHPEIISYVNYIEDAIRNPKNSIIYFSNSEEDHLVYYGNFFRGKGEIKVVVEKMDEKYGEIRSAYFSLNRSPGEKIAWICQGQI